MGTLWSRTKILVSSADVFCESQFKINGFSIFWAPDLNQCIVQGEGVQLPPSQEISLKKNFNSDPFGSCVDGLCPIARCGQQIRGKSLKC